MRPFLVEPPSGEIVDIEHVRDEARIDGASQDDRLGRNVAAAIALLDGYNGRLGRCILRQKWALPITDDADVVMLPFPDCREFSVERFTAPDTWSDVSGVTWEARTDCVALSGLPADRTGLYLTCFAGWETVSDVPENLKAAVRWLAIYWHDHPSGDEMTAGRSGLPQAFEAMISPLVSVYV